MTGIVSIAFGIPFSHHFYSLPSACINSHSFLVECSSRHGIIVLIQALQHAIAWVSSGGGTSWKETFPGTALREYWLPGSATSSQTMSEMPYQLVEYYGPASHLALLRFANIENRKTLATGDLHWKWVSLVITSLGHKISMKIVVIVG